MDLTFLGTTAGVPTKQRAHSAIALNLGSEILLFDCGENTQRQLMHAGLNPMKITSIFISHWHADHSAGLAGLIQTQSLMDRKKPLNVFGPAGTKKSIQSLLKIHHWVGHLRYPLNVKDVKKGSLVKTKTYEVKSIPAVHQPPSLSFYFKETDKPGRFNLAKAKKLGLKKEQYGTLQRGKTVKVGSKTIKPSQVMGPIRPGKVIVYSGDTTVNPELVKLAKGADLLINEATFGGELAAVAKEWGHCSAKEAAQIAKKAGVKELIITHFSPRYRNVQPLLKEAKQVFKKTKLAKDLMKIELK